MSKNKGGKNNKKEPAIHGKKIVSDYQAGKKSEVIEIVPITVKSKH